MTLPLELGGIQDPGVRRAFELVAQRFPLRGLDMSNEMLLLAVTGTQRKVAFGTGTVTFTAAVTSAATTITHGLGATPVVALVTGDNAAVFYDSRTKTSTQFSVVGYAPFGATSGTFTFMWVAVG